MESWHRNRLSAQQAGFVESLFPDVRLLNDLSWNLVDTAVLEVEHCGRRYVIKAAGPANHHIGREIDAHESFTNIWAAKDKAPSLLNANRSLNLLVTEYLEGCLVEGGAGEYDPDTYVQAGRLLRTFHAQAARVDPRYEEVATAKAMAWLERPHHMEKAAAEKARIILAAYRPESVAAVPTHGDWQPRNWLMNGTELRIIDFGRFGFRPALSDLCRLAAQQWRLGPELEDAFLEGYGSDPRDCRLWNLTMLREAVSTAAWAFHVGDREFEEQGHRMLRDALVNY